MFKNLKSRITEETKKLQNAVTQVSGNIPEKLTHISQGSVSCVVRDRKSDESPEPGASPTRALEFEDDLVDIPLHDNSLTVRDSSAERQRRDSSSSTGSYDSIFLHNYASSAVGTFVSDLDSIADEDTVSQCSTNFDEPPSMDDVSKTLNKLSTQAGRYRDKYKKALDAYRNLLGENEKLKNALCATQERAIARIRELRDKRLKETEDFQATVKDLNEKVAAVERAGNEDWEKHNVKVKTLEELLRQCKESITNYKCTVESMRSENEALKRRIEETERDDRVEEQWQLKMTRMEEDHSMTIAKLKQELHATNESECASLRQRLDSVGAEFDAAKEQLEQLTACLQAVENEKKQLLSELAAVKQASVRAVMEEEKQKRSALVAEYEEKLKNVETTVTEELSHAYEAKYKEKEKQLEDRIAEERSQLMLEAEEREMQKAAAILSQDELVTKLRVELEETHTALAELRSRAAERDELREQLHEANRELSSKSCAINAHEASIESLKKQLTEARRDHDANVEQQQQWSFAMESLKRTNDELQSTIEWQNCELDRLKDDVDRLKANQRDAAEADHSNQKIADLEGQLSLKEKELQNSEERRRTEAAEIERSYRSKVAELEDLVSLSAAELTKFRDQVSCAVEEINAYKEQLEKERNKSEYLEQVSHEQQRRHEEYCSCAQRDLSDMKAQLGTAERTAVEFELLLAVSRTERDNLVTLLEKANDDLASANRRCDELQSRYADVVHSSQCTIDSVKDQLAQSQNENANLLQEAEQLLKRVNADEELIRRMDSDMEALKKHAMNVEGDITATAVNLFGVVGDGYDILLSVAGELVSEDALSSDDCDRVDDELLQRRSLLAASIESSRRQLRQLTEERSWHAFVSSSIWSEAPKLLKASGRLHLEDSHKSVKGNDAKEEAALAEIDALNAQVKNLCVVRDFFQVHTECLKKFAARLRSIFTDDDDTQSVRRITERLEAVCDQWPIEVDASVPVFDDLCAALQKLFGDVQATLRVRDQLRAFADQLQPQSNVDKEPPPPNGADETELVERLRRIVRAPCASCARLERSEAHITSALSDIRSCASGVMDRVVGDLERVAVHLNNYETRFVDLVELFSKVRSALEERRRDFDGRTVSLKRDVESLQAVLNEKERQIDSLKKLSAWSDWGDADQTNATHSTDSRDHSANVGETLLCDATQHLSECIQDPNVLLPNGSSPLSHRRLQSSPVSYEDGRHGCSKVQQQHSRLVVDSTDFHPLFAEPTEAEYLKNILYRYMAERETLGKESVTLAKAIAAVVKFSPSQTKLILLKEESRNTASW